MELQFNKTVCPCLRKAVSQVQTQEQTQEVRLTDAMPDIGRVLGCWGQVLIRGKEWHTGGMMVSGGVMVWVLYAPEDGSEPRNIDTWIPFQMKWDFPDTKRDGTICVIARLKGMDGRSISARKLMVRASISIMGEALEPVEAEVFTPDTIPADIQLLRESYPMDLPQEAGEKHFQLDDEVNIPSNYPPIVKVIRYEVNPEIIEQKVMAGKLVFRGMCRLHILYASEDGGLHSWDCELPFSQFTELDRDYGPNATGWVIPVLTGMELETDDEGKLRLKCSLAAQYVIYDRVMMEVVEDEYSPQRKVGVNSQELKMPVRLDVQSNQIPFRQTLRAEGQKIVDATVFWEHPSVRQTGDSIEAAFPAQYQVLYVDENGSLQSASCRGEETWTLPSDRDNQVQIQTRAAQPHAVFGPDGIELSGNIDLDAAVHSERGIPMVTALEFGEQGIPDPGRPSLILRKIGEGRLWDLAKECGSTVEAIRKANQLQQEPSVDQVLLIPVY